MSAWRSDRKSKSPLEDVGKVVGCDFNYVVTPLVPPYKGGKQEKSGSLPFIRGGLGWGNADRDGKSVLTRVSR